MFHEHHNQLAHTPISLTMKRFRNSNELKLKTPLDEGLIWAI
jgi:hypothetical protein